MNGHHGCRETIVKLQTFLDRELQEEEIVTVRYHLEQCPPCQDLFRFEEHWRRLVRTRACNECAPPSLRDQILARMRAKT
jgi:mycothiol system anti-sigma-R factor